MQERPLGKSGMMLPLLGIGAGSIGDPSVSEKEAEEFLNGALDAGVTLIDTARAYSLSEERIGKFLKHRRQEFILSTKVGYGIRGYEDWTGACVTAGVDAALELMETDYIDIVHLHSCPLSIVQREDLIDALHNALKEGKVRIVGYAGDNDALEWAVKSGRFGAVQTSINLFDQRVLDSAVPIARVRGIGVIAKRPLANTPWRFPERPVGDPALQAYWERWQTMSLNPVDLSWAEFALRFVLSLSGIAACLIGTRNLDHLRQDVDIASRGALPDETVNSIRAAFRMKDYGWIGQI